MRSKPENDHDAAARLDRERTGDSVNARTDELKKDLDQDADRLQRKYVEPEKPKADGKDGKDG